MIQRQGQDEHNAQNIQDKDGQQNEHQHDDQNEHAGVYQQNHSYGYSHQGYYQTQLYTGYQDQQQRQYSFNNLGHYHHDGKNDCRTKGKMKIVTDEINSPNSLDDLDKKFKSLLSNKDKMSSSN